MTKQLKIALVPYFFSLHFGPLFKYIFLIFDVSYFLYFDIFVIDNVNVDSIKKKLINNFEMSVLKTECIKNKFLNSFKKMLKMSKTMQYIKNIFLEFFAILKKIRKGKDSGYDINDVFNNIKKKKTMT
jgi:hypothetical protein